MEQYITDERTVLKYELVGIWGQRHCSFLREHKHCTYSAPLMTGKQYGNTEALKAADQTKWVRRMSAARETAAEIANHELIYT